MWRQYGYDLSHSVANQDSADLAGSVRVPSPPHTVCVPLPKLQAQNPVETSFAYDAVL